MRLTIWPAPITPRDLTSAALVAAVELKLRAATGPLRQTERREEANMTAIEYYRLVQKRKEKVGVV